MTESTLFLNSTTAWHCLQDPQSNLIYFSHSKCATSFYKKIFLDLGWTDCTTLDIDWSKHIVFSYIRDPLIKHRMGIIEWFYSFSQTELLKQNAENDNFFQMLSEIVYLDIHSMSLREHLGEKIFSIHWIPIDVPDRNHLKETVDLLSKHRNLSQDQVKKILLSKPSHVSRGFKRSCIDKILKIPPTPLVLKSIEYDRLIYDQTIVQNFEPENYSARIKQLVDIGLSQLQAEKIADQEVKSGQYVNWIP